MKGKHMEPLVPISVEEYMQTLLRIGFTRQSVLEKCFDYTIPRLGVINGLPALEEAAKACSIHSEDVIHLNKSGIEFARSKSL